MKSYSNFFSDYHPIVLIIYFISIFALLISITHPVFILVGTLIFLLYVFLLSGGISLAKSLFFFLPIILFIALINPIFNRKGNTPLFYFNGNPYTLEALLFGVFAGILIFGMILLFRSLDQCISSHKFIYLFGRFLPTLAMMVTMTMHFIPMMKKRLNKIIQTQKPLGISIHSGKIKNRIASGSNILSVLVSVSLEGTIDTADSMKARGYNLSNKSHFHSYIFTARDYLILSITLAMDLFFGFIIIKGLFRYEFYPEMTAFSATIKNIVLLIIYGLFMALPILVNFTEEIKWKLSRRKI